MQPIERQIKSVLEQYRQYVDNFFEDKVAKKSIAPKEVDSIKSYYQLNTTLFAPCQIDFIELEKNNRKILFVTFDADRPDMEIVALKIPNNGNNLKSILDEFSKKHTRWLRPVISEDNEIGIFPANVNKKSTRKDFFEKTIMELLEKSKFGVLWSSISSKSSVYFFSDEHEFHPKQFLEKKLEEFTSRYEIAKGRYLEINDAENVASNLKEKVEEIEQDDIRVKLSSSVTEIEQLVNSYKTRLEKQENLTTMIQEDVNGVKQLVGVSKEFQDWRLLISDVTRLKEEHISKGEFDVKIESLQEKIDMVSKTLNEKIEREKEAVNTRIEDLKAIKFWSKRTLLEIALTAWGAFLTLYVTGIIKF